MSQAREPDREQVRALLEAIYARYGYDLRSYAPASIDRRVRAALARSQLRDLAELERGVVEDPAFFAEVLESLMVPVSDMFRDPACYLAFRTQVVPILRTYPQIRIWHAGCARGEEAYACAIVLLEEGLYDRAHIYATDLSAHAIEDAKRGYYTDKRVAGFAEGYRLAGGAHEFDHYYTAAYGRIAMKEMLRRNISFFRHDLVSDEVFGEMQLVFCRNVLIYFDRPLQARVLVKLARSLCPGGFLSLGASERLPRSEVAFAPFAAPARIYRRVS
jgi:chemotaxis protein methyltransferase CheR